jgi:hypothetical protein
MIAVASIASNCGAGVMVFSFGGGVLVVVSVVTIASPLTEAIRARTLQPLRELLRCLLV